MVLFCDSCSSHQYSDDEGQYESPGILFLAAATTLGTALDPMTLLFLFSVLVCFVVACRLQREAVEQYRSLLLNAALNCADQQVGSGEGKIDPQNTTRWQSPTPQRSDDVDTDDDRLCDRPYHIHYVRCAIKDIHELPYAGQRHASCLGITAKVVER